MAKEKFHFSMPTLCAFAWFGHACGASMITGRLAIQYCSRHGPLGILSAVLMWVVTVGFGWILIEYGRLVKAKSYKDVVNTIYWPNKIVGRVMLFVWDLITLYSVIVVSGSCLAAVCSALQSTFGIKYSYGTVLFLACILILFLGGGSILSKLGVMGMPNIFILLFICVLVIALGWGNLQNVMAGDFNSAIAAGAETLSSVFTDGFTYGLAQSGFIATAVVYAGEFKGSKDTTKACALGFLMGCGAMVVCTVADLAWFPGINKAELPYLEVLQTLKGSFVYVAVMVLYYYVMIVEILSTAVSLLIGAISRYKPLLGKIVKNEKICTGILLVVLLFSATIIGQLGLTAIVNKGFGLLGKMRIYTWFYPLIILGPIAIHRVKKQQKLAVQQDSGTE